MAGGDYNHANNRRPHNFSTRKIITSNEFSIDLFIIDKFVCSFGNYKQKGFFSPPSSDKIAGGIFSGVESCKLS